MTDESEAEAAVNDFVTNFERIRTEICKFMVGQDDVIEKVLTAVIAGGHVLLEGVPGIGKTALVRSLAQCTALPFKRIQFTPDLLPADILGTNILVEKAGTKQFEFQKGPAFTNILLADEINRATPKTQSALLETMQEKTVTVGGTTHNLDLPYFVLATQNPIEMDGTYPLPEAQLDRFFFKLNVELPDHAGFAEVLKRTTGVEAPVLEKVMDGETILALERTARQVPVADEVQDYLIRLVTASHPGNAHAPADVKTYVRYGASPRAAQAILTAARIHALLNGRVHVAKEDIREVATPALRHRIILSFEGEAEGIGTDAIIEGIKRDIDMKTK